MKVKFETAFRWYVIALVAVLLWSVWASAQPVTNAAPASPPAKLNPTDRLISAEWLTFGLDQVESLKPELFERPRWQYCASLIYIALAFLAAWLIDAAVRGSLRKSAAKKGNEFNALLLRLLSGPVKVVSFVLLLHIGLRIFPWPQWVEEWVSNGLHILVAISLTYLAVKCIDLMLEHWRARAKGLEDRAFDDMLFPVLSKTLKAFAIVVAALLTSHNLGLNITSLLASLSIGGLALGLAAQDTLANLFGAVAVYVDQPFRLGDRIQLDKVDGTVEHIGLRSTKVRSLDGYLVTVPNKTMGNATITNVSRRPTIKTEMNFSLSINLPSDKVKRAVTILEEIYRGHSKTADLIVSFNKFTDSALNVVVVHWWNDTNFKAYIAGMQELNLSIKARFDAEGITFATPTQTVVLRGNAGNLGA